tara:strand:- start:1951 stop:2553 length:603 start_codon:yes stop_codon:yes gene_type:complete
MGFTLSVRDTSLIETIVKGGKSPFLDEDGRNNSKVLFGILTQVPRVMPSFVNISEEDLWLFTDAVAYLMRPDILITGTIPLGPVTLPDEKLPRFYGEDGIYIHFKNNPNELNPMWSFPDEDGDMRNMAAELMRCCGPVSYWVPGMLQKLGNDAAYAPHAMVEVTAFLLFPKDLADYEYTPWERARYHRTIWEESNDGEEI